MKKVLFPILALALVLAMASAAIPAQAADEADIQTSIDDGVTWLVDMQDPIDGSWGGEHKVAMTGFAVVKLEDLAFERDMSPFDPAYEYSSNVTAGLDYIFGKAGMDTCGIRFEGDWVHDTYATGVAMMAIAAGRDMGRIVSVGNPAVDGMTYGQVLEANVDYFTNSQTSEGGWSYSCNSVETTCQSNTGYAVLGLRYAETAGISIPNSIRDGLENWIVAIQDPVDGDSDDGGSWYRIGWPWINLLKTGHLLFEMAFVGDTLATQRVQDAIDYIERHWDDANSDPGWRPNHYQAMYSLMKGLESFNIQTIEVGGSAIDWYDQFADAIIASQIYGGLLGDGYWPWDNWGDEVLSTEWALLTLERVVPPSETTVPVDIHPTSCRNPLDVGSKGVLPVAILGTEDFDVTQIDSATVLLGNVPALRWALEDVAAPFEPYIGKEDAFDCTTEGPDGYLDLTLKFDTQAVVADIGYVEDGDVLLLQLTGNLKEEYGGTAIMGEDVVVILKKGK